MKPPANPKIYHIVHVDRLASIGADGLVSDSVLNRSPKPGTVIGMSSIKARRLTLPINSRKGICVGDCVPFYFCPRSIMLFLIHRANHEELAYKGGQEPIVHLEADRFETVAWAETHQRKWAFTLSNAGAFYFEDRCHLAQLNEINWAAVQATQWSGNGISRSVKEGKQAEFLIHEFFPWSLVSRVGVRTQAVGAKAISAMASAAHRPPVEIVPAWYY